MKPITILLWILVFYSGYLVFNLFRAKIIIRNLRGMESSRKQWSKVELDPKQVPSWIRKSWAGWIDRISALGFTRLVTYSSLTGRQWVGENFSESHRNSEGSILFSSSVYISPHRMLFIFPLPFPRWTGRVNRGRVLETEFENGVVLNTHDLVNAPAHLPDDFIQQQLPPGTPENEMLAEHLKQMEKITADQKTKPRPIQSAEQYFEYSKRAKAILGRQRLVNVEELVEKISCGSEAVKQIIDPDGD